MPARTGIIGSHRAFVAVLSTPEIAMFRRFALPLLTALAAACSDDPTRPAPLTPEPVPLHAETCDSTGTMHAGAIGAETWRAADNPHAVVDTLWVNGLLTVEAGVEVCVEPDVPILVGGSGAALRAIGTAADSIVFTAGDPARPWGGIHLPAECTGPTLFGALCTAGATTIDHARIEYAASGVAGGSAAAVRNSHVRQIRCDGVSASYIAHTRVDTAGIDGCPAVVIGQSAVRGGEDTFIQNRITGSGGPGLSLYGAGLATSGVVGGRIMLTGGRIEGSHGVGISFAQTYRGGVSQPAPIRITGGAQAAFVGPWRAFRDLWPTTSALDSIRGNAGDSIVVWEVSGRSLTIPSGFTLILETAPPAGQPWAELESLEALPGSRLVTRTTLYVPGVIAEGTPEDPVHIRGELFLGCGPGSGACTGVSRFAHVEMDEVRMTAYLPTTFDTVVMRRGALHLTGTARLTAVRVEDADWDGIAIGADSITITDCVIRRSAAAGIVVFDHVAGLTVRNCAIEQNAGPGIQNLAPDTVDARFNWWGDTDGPFGPAGDGIEGLVDSRDFLTAPPDGAASAADSAGMPTASVLSRSRR